MSGYSYHHLVDLETAAALGCSKCIDELEMGTKQNSKCHDANCPRGRGYRPGRAQKAGATGSKRKWPQAARDDAGDVGANDNTTAAGRSTEGNVDDEDTDGPPDRSAPLRVGNSIDFPLSNVRPHLICSLCEGYFRDPHTVADCLHTFCRSCLVLFFRHGNRCCPTCNSRLGPDPFHTSISIQSREVIPDRTLQEIVHKMFPWMKAREDDEERIFYKRRGIKMKPVYSQGGGEAKAQEHRQGSKATVSAGAMNDMLDLRLEPDGHPSQPHQRLPPLRNPILRTSGRLKIVSIKKYLVQKLGLRDAKKSSIEILCNRDVMGDELNLTFIFRTRWFLDNQVLMLRYRLEEEEDEREQEEEEGRDKEKEEEKEEEYTNRT